MLVVLVVFLSAIGNVLLSVGMKHVGAVDLRSMAALAAAAAAAAVSPALWLGVGSLIGFFIAYLLLLSWADYSFVSPVTAIGYVLVPLLGWSLLGEQVSPIRWAGIAVICLGVALVSGTPPCTTAPVQTSDEASAGELARGSEVSR